ncbi:PadR family transcriptional regulator [Amnibacterium kyonggiense]
MLHDNDILKETTMEHIHDHHPHQHGGMRGRFDGPFGHRGPRGGFGGPWDGPAEALRAFKGFGPGPGFGPHGPRARRGDVRSAILGLLSDGPSNGYGLIKAIGEKTEGAWTPSPGSVYPTLAQLVDEGLISQEGGPRGAYELTDAGRTYVTAHQEEIDAAFRSAGDRFQGGDALMTAFGKLAGAAMQFRGGVTPEQRARATEKVDELRRELYRILGE